MTSDQLLTSILSSNKTLNNKVDLGKVIDQAQELDLVQDLELDLKRLQLEEGFLQKQAMIEYTRHQLYNHPK